ncbi:type 1 glutamine amidotransferase domain-containing protein [Methanobacterium ferruginis]|uniref:type 1 glutamine amidotransferase domain-containing protein n=1 Tax=Methanobacterium ferruginis TaxID=710191 RepID=UPI00257413CB|nr:type 1 glutamine amidotransferase domain-containing protein [Methanobacterium ferruginis]BDZ68933.1 glutamine amidotransferase [Methanobacterium ferruginis]
MATIGIIIADMFEDVEYTEPANAFKKAGHQIVPIGLEKGKTVRGKRDKTPVKIDKGLDEVSPYDFDAILIPGGYSPDILRGEDKAVEFIKVFFNSGKPIFAICHGPQLLITAHVLDGKKVTGWKSIIQDIKNSGAEYINQEVVVDDNLISSRGPRDLSAFIKASLKRLE